MDNNPFWRTEPMSEEDLDALFVASLLAAYEAAEVIR